jgi:hypothetical protein
VVGWDLLAARTNGESLTYVFRRGVAETAWRWPVLILIILLTIHLFLPPRLRKHDPIDRLYQRFNPAYSQPSEPPVPDRLSAQRRGEPGDEQP